MRKGSRGVVVGLAALLLGAAPAGAAGRRPDRSVTLEWVGDMAMSTQLGLPPGGVANALAPVSNDLHGADVTFGNLEGTLSVSGPSKCATLPAAVCFAFQAPPSTAYGLRRLGFRLVNQANNHSLDYGYSGRAQTVAALDAAGVEHTGFPGEITYLRARGLRIAFLGFAPYPFDSNLLDIPAAQAMIRRAHEHASLVVVIIHAGAEGADQTHTPYGEQYYLGEDRGNARAFAHAAIQAGASLVVGSGPHVIRGVEDYRGRMIAYSLGNFIGYHTLGGGGVLSLSAILRVTLDQRGRVLAARWIPIVLDNGLPRPDPSGASAHLVAALSREDFHRYWTIEGNGTLRIPASKRRRRHAAARAAATPGLSVTGYQEETDPTSAITASARALSFVGIDGVDIYAHGTAVDQPDSGALRQLAVAHRDHLAGILLVSNWDDAINNFSERLAYGLLGDPAAIASVASTLAGDVTSEGWDGISIDLESLLPRDTNGLTAFATALRADLPPSKSLAIDVTNFTSAAQYRANGYDIAALGQVVNVFALMAYDDHGPWENTPGPIGPLSWQKAGLAVVLRAVAAAKVDLGVAGYGYAWRPHHHNLQLSVTQSRALARRGGGAPRWVARVGEWTARLRDGSVLWWSDARSYRLRVALGRADHLHGLAVWALGQDDPL